MEVTMPDLAVPGTRPVLVTVPAVEVLSVGTWAASSGVFTVTGDDLYAAVAAFDDPGYTRPYLKIGHSDPRFNAPVDEHGEPLDGQPAIGRLINPRVTDDAMTLVVDIAGVPAWLADIMPTAWPSRSIEGLYRLKTQTGTVHRFALTGLALLGVQAPAVSTLADIATLFGLDPVAVAASAAHSLTEESMPPTSMTVAASVNLDTVRQDFYSAQNEELRRSVGGSWAWIREVYTDFVVVDDDEGHLYRLPWSEDPATPGDIVWGTPTPVKVQYVDVPADKVAASGGTDALRRGSLRARLAAMATIPVAASEPAPAGTPAEPAPQPPEPAPAVPVVPAAEPEPTPDPMEDNVSDLSDIARGLGLPDDAGKDTILAAISAGKTAEPPTPPAAPASAEPATGPAKELVAASTGNDEYATELKRLSGELAAIKEKERAQIKASVLDGAQREGKYAPAERASWEARYDKAPDVITDVLASIAPGTAVPVAAAGVTGSDEPTVVDVDATEATGWASLLGIPAEELTRG